MTQQSSSQINQTTGDGKQLWHEHTQQRNNERTKGELCVPLATTSQFNYKTAQINFNKPNYGAKPQSEPTTTNRNIKQPKETSVRSLKFRVPVSSQRLRVLGVDAVLKRGVR